MPIPTTTPPAAQTINGVSSLPIEPPPNANATMHPRHQHSPHQHPLSPSGNRRTGVRLQGSAPSSVLPTDLQAQHAVARRAIIETILEIGMKWPILQQTTPPTTATDTTAPLRAWAISMPVSLDPGTSPVAGLQIDSARNTLAACLADVASGHAVASGRAAPPGADGRFQQRYSFPQHEFHLVAHSLPTGVTHVNLHDRVGQILISASAPLRLPPVVSTGTWILQVGCDGLVAAGA